MAPKTEMGLFVIAAAFIIASAFTLVMPTPATAQQQDPCDDPYIECCQLEESGGECCEAQCDFRNGHEPACHSGPSENGEDYCACWDFVEDDWSTDCWLCPGGECPIPEV